MDAAAGQSFVVRLAVPLLKVAIFAGSFVVVLMPLGYLWLISHLDLATGEFYVSALLGCPVAIVVSVWLLLKLNRGYVRLADEPRPILERSISFAVICLLLALAVWVAFLGGGSNPSLGP